MLVCCLALMLWGQSILVGLYVEEAVHDGGQEVNLETGKDGA